MTIQQALTLAMQHHQAGRLREAESLYRQVLATQPNQPDALHLLGAIALDAGDAATAAELISRAVAANPSAAVYHGNLGLALLRMGRPQDAITSLQRALSLSAGRFPDAWFNLGNALRDLGQLDAAVDAYQHALSLQPAHRKALNNLANAMHLLGRLDEAMALHHKTLELAPGWPLARYNRGITLLFQGDFERGWAEYEQRLLAPELPLPPFQFASPRWDGSDLNGKRILIYSDQGFGDAFFSMRFIPRVAQEKLGHVILAVQPELERVAHGVSGVSEVVTKVDASVQYEVHAAMMSLPFLFKTTPASIPDKVPYVSTDPSLRAEWRARIAGASGIKIGIVWSGRAYPPGRSIPMQILAERLRKVRGAAFVSLQKGASEKEVQAAFEQLALLDVGAEITDFADTAALIDNLDLILSVDTAVAHLAGAMGKPTWVLLQQVPDWRWMLGRDDSAWYPTMKLFRQSVAGDWRGPLARVVHELRSFEGIEVGADSAEDLSDLGNALLLSGRAEEAIDACRRAAELRPQAAEIHNNLAAALQSAGHVKEAVSAYERALSLDLQLADAHYGLALALLKLGDYPRGFVEHEWRWRVSKLNLQRQQFVQPEWDGSESNGRRILVYAEQGFGDTLQFARLLSQLRTRGGAVLFACRPELKTLMRSVPGVQAVLTTGDPTPAFDVHCPLLSLPRLLRTTLDTIPWNGPYLAAPADRIAHWRRRVQETGAGLKVGLTWAGRASHTNDRNRSIKADDLAALMNIPRAIFFSLQKDPLNSAARLSGIVDNASELHDFVETASLIENLDLVITVDTAVAHLAGALGKETWILLPYDSDWRWLIGRSDSPWYPSVRLFRQPAPRDWHSVLRTVAEELGRRSSP